MSTNKQSTTVMITNFLKLCPKIGLTMDTISFLQSISIIKLSEEDSRLTTSSKVFALLSNLNHTSAESGKKNLVFKYQKVKLPESTRKFYSILSLVLSLSTSLSYCVTENICKENWMLIWRWEFNQLSASMLLWVKYLNWIRIKVLQRRQQQK